MKILVALSGGVDSSVTAHLLKEQGHELIGVMMKLWVDPLAPEVRSILPSKCCSIEHIERARSVCNTLDIPFYVLNIEDEFKENVVDPYLKSHAEGKTPNPCIYCNREVKFGKLLEKMSELGCEKLATGHYAQIVERDGIAELHQAADPFKDQSYYLYSLGTEALSKILLPLGGMEKTEVFELAKKFDVPLREDYNESQDLCFFPEREPNEFLKRHLDSIEPGDIVTEDGEKVGEHKGLPFYTTGQRKGLNIGGLRIPLHVSRKDTSTNTLYVAEAGKDMSNTLKANNLYWLDETYETSDTDFSLKARTSSLGNMIDVHFSHDGQVLQAQFDNSIRGIAPGQSIVLYNGTRVVGGGEIM